MIEPEFISIDKLSTEQLTDPDYAIKQIDKININNFEITVCSKCHHCR
jgi:hypothetical protein